MAKTKISEYDATAANNTDIDSISVAEGMAPSNVNNAIRELMAHLKDMDAGTQALTSPQLTSVDINGGTIDGAVMGASAAAAATVTTLDTSGAVNLNLVTDSTSSTSGALIVDGGVGIAKKLYVGTDLDVSGNAVIDGTALVTGVLTTTAATVFNGGFASNAVSTITTADNLDTLSLISTDADANVAPNLRMYRNSGSPAANDQIGKIQFEGRNDNSQDVVYSEVVNQIKDASDGTEDGRFAINVMLGGTSYNRIDMQPTETIFNNDGRDLDFRVESNGNANALFVDGGGKSTGINVVPEVSYTSSLAIGFGGNNITSRGDADFRIFSGAFQDGASTFQYSVSSVPVSMLSMTNGGFAFQSAIAGTDGNAATFTTNFYIDPDGTISTPTLGTSNVRFGVNAGDAIASGGNYNVAVGDEAGTAISTGDYNVGVGYAANLSVVTTSGNTAIGATSGKYVTGANNTHVGYAAGQGISGVLAAGDNNTTVGSNAGLNLQGVAQENTLIGVNSGDAITTGQYNTCLGKDSGSYTVNLTTGQDNILIGAYAHTTAVDSNRVVALGYNVAGAEDFTTLGYADNDIRAAHGTATWAAVSDQRYKKDIVDSTAGLSFINALQPRTFKYKTLGELPEAFNAYKADSTEVFKNSDTNHGFIAQEVKAAIDADSSIKDGFRLWDDRPDGSQEVAEAALIPVLTKAVQELSTALDAALARIATLEG